MRHNGRPIYWLISATFFLSLLSVLNGSPLVFPDTGTYILQAAKMRGVIDRPPYYSIFLLGLHWKITLWTIPLAQNAIVSYVLFRFLRLEFATLRDVEIFLIVVATGLLSYLPWASNEIMPDIFAPLILLVVYILAFRWERITVLERVMLPPALAGMIAFHQANTVLAFGFLAIALVFCAFRRAPLVAIKRTTVLIAVPIALAVGAQSLYGYLVIGRITPSPWGPFFLLARVIYDGPGKTYLEEACPAKGYYLCNHLDDLDATSDEFLWGNHSTLGAMIHVLKEQRALDEANRIVAGTLRTHFFAEFGAGLKNWGLQLVRFGTADQSCPCLDGRVNDTVKEIFPGEYPAYANSLQNRGAWPLTAISLVDRTAVILGLVALLALFPRAEKNSRQCVLYLCGGIVLNAAVMGALAGPADRYQARMIWIIPMCAMATVLSQRAIRRRKPEA